jgi:hypothetical protein
VHKSATKCNEIVGKWCINNHGASKIIDTLETYHGRPRGSKNKSAGPAVVASSPAPAKRRPGRPAGSKNKPKVSSVAPGPSAPPHNASPPPPPKIYSFFCIADAQCREIQRVPLKFT